MQKVSNWIVEHPYQFYLFLIIYGVLVFFLFYPMQEVRDSRGRTELYRAAEIGDLRLVIELLTDGVEVDARDDCRWTPMMRASQNGHVEVVQTLIRYGADINLVDKGGYTALMLAAGDNQIGVLQLLLRYGASLNLQDTTAGWSALIWAAREGHTEAVRQLLAAGVDRSLLDRSGKTALAWATEKGHQGVIELLQERHP